VFEHETLVRIDRSIDKENKYFNTTIMVIIPMYLNSHSYFALKFK